MRLALENSSVAAPDPNRYDAVPNPALNVDAHRRAFSPPAVAG